MYPSLLTTLSSISLFVDNLDTFLKKTFLLHFWRVTEKRRRECDIHSASTHLPSMSPAFLPSSCSKLGRQAGIDRLF